MKIITSLFVSLGLFILLAIFLKGWLDTPVMSGPEVRIGNTKKLVRYDFKVAKAGAIIEIKLDATLPDNTWKEVEVEVFSTREGYLFTYFDELWTETGIDKGYQKWRESSINNQARQRIPVAGEYYLLVRYRDSPALKNQPKVFYLSVRQLRGDSHQLETIMEMIALPVFALSVCLVFVLSALTHIPTRKRLRLREFAMAGHLWFLPLLLLPVLITAGVLGSRTDTSPIDWPLTAFNSKKITHMAGIRSTKSLSQTFRGGAGKGGK